MAEYTKREAVITKINNIAKDYINDGSTQCSIAAGTVIDIRDSVIMKAPTADVVEVKHGYWKPKHYDNTNFEECSVCRHYRFFDDIRFGLPYEYCPKCGAKMDLKEGAEE